MYNFGCCYLNFHRPSAENVLCCTIKLGKEAKPEPVLEQVCAVLNSGGGRVEMKIDGFSNFSHEYINKQLDKFWSKVEAKLNPLILPLTYSVIFDRVLEGDKILLSIKAPDHFCSLDHNLFSACDTSVLPASYNKVVELLSKTKEGNIPEVQIQDIPKSELLPKTFTYREVLTFHESKSIQFKCFPSGNKILHNNNRTQHEQIRRHISGFGNVSGGVILLGVDDCGRVVGQSMEGDSEKEVEGRIRLVIDKMSKTWSFTPEKNLHWDVKFFPVVNKESNSVIVIYIAGMQNLGGIFTGFPKSYEICECKKGCHWLDFQQWKQRMLGQTSLGW